MSLVEAIRGELARRADPAKAPGMQAYMKSAMPYLGVTTPVLREACRIVFAGHPLASEAEWHATVRDLWYGASFREERYAALELIAHKRYSAYRTLNALQLYEDLIVHGAWWDLVDGLATHAVGDLLRRYPEHMRPRLLAWSSGPDHWLRRTSIICQVGFKAATDTELLFACIEPSLTERDFFLRKGIGWALRELAKANPQAVAIYVEEHQRQLSPLSRREALKYVPSNLQSAGASV